MVGQQTHQTGGLNARVAPERGPTLRRALPLASDWQQAALGSYCFFGCFYLRSPALLQVVAGFTHILGPRQCGFFDVH